MHVRAIRSCVQKCVLNARSIEETFSPFAFQPADVPKPVIAPGPVLKANSLCNLEQEKSTYRYVALTEPWAAK